MFQVVATIIDAFVVISAAINNTYGQASSQKMTGLEYADMFRPPINRAMRVLDRPFFQKKVPLAAARVLEKKHIAKCRTELENDILKLERVSVVKTDPVDRNLKALLLRPEIKCDSMCCDVSHIFLCFFFSL